MKVYKIFLGFTFCSVIALNAVLTLAEKEALGEELILQAKYGTVEDVKKCLDAGANVNFTGDSDGRTALHWVTYCGNYDKTKLLIDHKANINAQDDDGNTALILVIHGSVDAVNRAKILKILLDVKGIKVNRKNNENQTALHFAAANRNIAVCELLIKHGACVNVADKEWDYPVDVVRHSKKLKEILNPTGIYRLIHFLTKESFC